MTARFFIVKESERKGKDKNNSEIMKQIENIELNLWF